MADLCIPPLEHRHHRWHWLQPPRHWPDHSARRLLWLSAAEMWASIDEAEPDFHLGKPLIGWEYLYPARSPQEQTK